MKDPISENTILLRLGKTYHLATTEFEQSTGISASRWRLLYLIELQAGISQKQLVKQLRVDAGSITRQLSALEAEQLVRRQGDAQDARIMRLSLTPAGRQEVRRIHRLREKFLQAMVAGIPDHELQITLQVLDRIGHNLGDDALLPVGLSETQTRPARPRAPRAVNR